jgi:hypothetical protein
MTKKFKIDLTLVARGLGLPDTECRALFSDGRMVGHFVERKLVYEFGWKLSASKSSPWDAVDSFGKRLEIRCLTDKIIFRPSNQIGQGRDFEESSFIDKLKQIDGYVIVDIKKLPELGVIEVARIPIKRVWRLYRKGILGKNAEVGYKKARKLFFHERE